MIKHCDEGSILWNGINIVHWYNNETLYDIVFKLEFFGWIVKIDLLRFGLFDEHSTLPQLQPFNGMAVNARKERKRLMRMYS